MVQNESPAIVDANISRAIRDTKKELKEMLKSMAENIEVVK